MHTKLLYYRRDFKVLATTDDLTKIKNLRSNTDIIESCTRKRANTKWKFYKMTKVTIFAALLKEVRMGCKETVLPDQLLKNLSATCLTFEEKNQKPCEENLCLFSALAWHLHGNERLESETSILFNNFLEKNGWD